MNCINVKKCVCPKIECPNHRKCCDCIIKHKETDSLPFCLFPDNGGDKSNENYYHKLKNRFEMKSGGYPMKPIVRPKNCFASKDACIAIKLCPAKAISYIDVEEPILDKTLKCNCNEREELGLTPMSVEGYSGGCDCTSGCCEDSGDDLYACGGTPYGRIIIDYDKCTGCGICAKECCGNAIDMIAESETATIEKPADGNVGCCCPGGKC